MVQAKWNGVVIAESDSTVIVEGNHYFPRASVQDAYLEASNTHTTCGWKGVADYFTLVVDGQRNVDAAWTYPDAKEKAKEIEGFVAFWKGVEVG